MKTLKLGELKRRLEWLWNLEDGTDITIGGGKLSLLRANTILYAQDNQTPKIVDLELAELYEITFDPDKAE